MPPQDQDFLKASPKDQHAYMMATDPDYAKASPQDQNAYLQHLAPQQKEPSTYDKLTSAEDPGAMAFDQKHPILGKGVRTMSAIGGAAMGLPGNIYHAMADPLTPEEEQDFQGHMRIPGEVGLERLTGARQMVNAGRDYAGGKVSPSAAMSVLPEAIGQGVGTVAGAELGGRALGAAGRFGRDLPGVPGQAIRTAGKMVANTDLTKPFKAASKLPEYWRKSSPESVAHMREMNDPMRVATRNAILEKRADPIKMSKLGARAPGEAGSMAGSVANSPVTFIPEPSPTPAGIDPNNMGSVPRSKLGPMALRRVPGAGRQMQQLGQSIIYIPNEADLPPRR